jgi:ABC-2 type transport system permease protein
MIALLRTELSKAALRRRTFVMLVLLVVLPLIVMASIGNRPPRPRDIGQDVGTFRLMQQSGILAAPALLRWQFEFLLLIIAALFAGDAMAGDANAGALRYLLIRPVGRGKLLASKAMVAVAMAFALILVITFALAVAGAVKFGTAPIHIDAIPGRFNGGLAIPTIDLTVFEQWTRCFLLALYLTLGFGGVIGVGLLFSVIADQPVGAVGGAIAFHIVSGTFDALQPLGKVRYALPTYYREGWRALFIEDKWFSADIARNLLVNSVWFALAYAAAHWWFCRKDIHT